jgi:hypothetical protein
MNEALEKLLMKSAGTGCLCAPDRTGGGIMLRQNGCGGRLFKNCGPMFRRLRLALARVYLVS